QPSATVENVSPAQEPQVRQTSTTSTTSSDNVPIPTNSSSHATNIPITSQDVDELNPNAMVDGNTFVNPFSISSTSAAQASSSSQHVDPSNMHGNPNPTASAFNEARLVSKRVANQEETPSLDNILSLTNRFEDILGVSTSSDEIIGVEADVSNMETSIQASPTPTLRIHKDHPKSQIIGPMDTPI
nr:hypothetical protein [Tanacetum cinerariifolium]